MKKYRRLCLFAVIVCLSACTSDPLIQEKKETSSNEKVHEKAKLQLEKESKPKKEKDNSNEVEQNFTEDLDITSSKEKKLQIQKQESPVQSNTNDNVSTQEKETTLKESLKQPSVPVQTPQEKPNEPNSTNKPTTPEVPDVPTCSNDIPNGTYKSEDEAAAYAESVILDNLINGDGSLTGYNIERAQTGCGTIYYILVIY